MPSTSVAQQHLMQAAEHGATFPIAKKLRKTMTHTQLHDFSVGSEKGKPMHVLKGDRPDVVASNTTQLKATGMSELDAIKEAILTSKKGHPNRHKNLGKFLHSKKTDKKDGII